MGNRTASDEHEELPGAGWVAQLVRVSSQYAKVSGLIPSQGTNRKQPMSATN